MSRTYQITTQTELRRAFWAQFPDLDRRTIPDHEGAGRMHKADARCAFVDWIDSLCRDGQISPTLAERATL